MSLKGFSLDKRKKQCSKGFYCWWTEYESYFYAIRVAYLAVYNQTFIIIIIFMKRSMSRKGKIPQHEKSMKFFSFFFNAHGKFLENFGKPQRKFWKIPDTPIHSHTTPSRKCVFQLCLHTFSSSEKRCFSFRLHLRFNGEREKAEKALILWKHFLEHRSALKRNIDKMRHRKGGKKLFMNYLKTFLSLSKLFLLLLTFSPLTHSKCVTRNKNKGAEKTIIFYWIFDEEIKNVCRNWYCVGVKKRSLSFGDFHFSVFPSTKLLAKLVTECKFLSLKIGPFCFDSLNLILFFCRDRFNIFFPLPSF